jgi:hypothetical protein
MNPGARRDKPRKPNAKGPNQFATHTESQAALIDATKNRFSVVAQ